MRVLFTCLLLVLLLQPPAAARTPAQPPAAAYTLVMRGGRRVEIKGGFHLSGAQLTYEAAPGVSVTLPLALVDVEATERANNEPAGGFLRRATAGAGATQKTVSPQKTSGARPRVNAPTRRPALTLTNKELEPVRRARVESERAYERRRAELGLPSAEEARRRDEEEERALAERARRKAEEEEDAEGHWRERAAELREEAGALDAEINYLRSLLAESSDSFSTGFSSTSGVAAGALSVIAGSRPGFGRSGFNFGRRGFNFGRGSFATTAPDAPFFARNPANALLQNTGPHRFGRSRASFNLDGGTRVRLGVGGRDRLGGRGKFAPRPQRGRFTHRGSRFFAPGLVGVVGAFDYGSADSFALATRLRLLESERAGIAARWRLLEEQARRAGAQPGWLRP